MAIQDDYLPCKSYQGHDISEERISKFLNEKSKKHYFAFLDETGSVTLRSEGYTTEKSRDKGLESVLKNISDSKKVEIVKEGKRYFIIVKAGNNKEIARSCDYSSQKAVDEALQALTKVSPATAEEKTSNFVEGQMLLSLEGYLPVDMYLDRERVYDTYGITGFVKFRTNDRKYYFGVLNPDATLYLRSKAYDSEDDRDDAFDVMESSILLEENYKIENLNGDYYAVLFEDDEVLAISDKFETFIEAFVTTPGGRPKEYIGTMY